MDPTLPTSVHTPEARRLFRALSDALREMRVRQAQAPTDATPPLRLGIIATAENGTALDVQTASTNLRTLDLEAEPDRTIVLRELRTLEREFLYHLRKMNVHVSHTEAEEQTSPTPIFSSCRGSTGRSTLCSFLG